MSRPIIALALAATCGCARYRPDPVDPAALSAAWRALDGAGATAVLAEAGGERPAGFDLGDGIDLAEAEACALFFNPRLRATRLALGIEAAGAEHAGSWEDPELGIDGEYVLGGVDEPLVAVSKLSLTIPLSGRPAVRRRLARAELAAGEAEVLGAEWALLDRLRRAWSEHRRLARRIELLVEAKAEVAGLFDAAEGAVEAGKATAFDRAELAIRLRRIEGERRRTAAARTGRRLDLVALCGLNPDHPWKFAGDAVPRGRADRDLAEHPAVATAMAAYAVAERRLELAVRGQYPDLRVGLGAGLEEGDPRVALAASLIPLPVWNRNRRDVGEADAARDAARAEVERALRELIQRRHRAEADLAAARGRVAFLEGELAPLLDAQIAEAKRLIRLGDLDLFRVAGALAAARELELELLDARFAAIESELVLQALAGPPPEEEP